MGNKTRKTLNISLQSKKYAEAINKIVNDWEEEGSNTSAEVCKLILLQDKYDKSITLSTVRNIFELIQRMVGLYIELDTPESNKLIEDVLSRVITINNSELSISLANLNEKLSNLKGISVDNQVNEVNQKLSEEKTIKDSYSEPPARKSFQQNTQECVELDDDNLIPMDFLSNS